MCFTQTAPHFSNYLRFKKKFLFSIHSIQRGKCLARSTGAQRQRKIFHVRSHSCNKNTFNECKKCRYFIMPGPIIQTRTRTDFFFVTLIAENLPDNYMVGILNARLTFFFFKAN